MIVLSGSTDENVQSDDDGNGNIDADIDTDDAVDTFFAKNSRSFVCRSILYYKIMIASGER